MTKLRRFRVKEPPVIRKTVWPKSAPSALRTSTVGALNNAMGQAHLGRLLGGGRPHHPAVLRWGVRLRQGRATDGVLLYCVPFLQRN